jgi:hypothetical protein
MGEDAATAAALALRAEIAASQVEIKQLQAALARQGAFHG